MERSCTTKQQNYNFRKFKQRIISLTLGMIIWFDIFTTNLTNSKSRIY
jgi:hypothetical protein